MSNQAEVRLDKWLWAARFFKTRSLATEAVKSGRVHVNGHRVKPGKAVVVGQILRINKAPQVFEVEVLDISDKRGSFTIAQQLYNETEASIARRQQEAEMRKLAHSVVDPHTKGRPTKRNRRQLEQWMQGE